MKGTLFLFPNTLGKDITSDTIPSTVQELVEEIRVFIVEDIRNARRYLKRLKPEIVIDDLVFHVLNEHTSPEEVPEFLEELSRGDNAAVISEAGVPGIADPGAQVVSLAHRNGIRVVPLTGPSSIMLSLMASGLNGQAFTFHGYLPIKKPERIQKIRELEQRVIRSGETQVFIEAPYRNDALLRDILATCKASTILCIAADITLESEEINTKSMMDWKKHMPVLHKRPVVFLLGS